MNMKIDSPKISDKITKEELSFAWAGGRIEIELFRSQDGTKKLSMIFGGDDRGRHHLVLGDMHMWNYNRALVLDAYNSYNP